MQANIFQVCMRHCKEGIKVGCQCCKPPLPAKRHHIGLRPALYWQGCNVHDAPILLMCGYFALEARKFGSGSRPPRVMDRTGGLVT